MRMTGKSHMGVYKYDISECVCVCVCVCVCGCGCE